MLVLEREPEFYGTARAVYTDDEAMRVFQTAGVADDIHGDMNVDSVVQWVRADGSVLVQFRTFDRPLGWPVTNFLYQPYLETRLEALLDRYPHVEVRRGREVLDFSQDAHGVTVEHAGVSGSAYGSRENVVDHDDVETARASYLIGADGGRSMVRLRLDIAMSGTSFPERWLVVDLAAREGVDAFRHLPYFDFVCDPDLPTVSCPQPGGHHRFEFALTDADDAAEFEADETVRRLIGRYVDVDEVVVDRQLVYTFNAVTADRWRDGRVLLAGDAAHMTPQFVGQGMNSGVRDADNLSWKLEAVLRHGADPAVLDSYETERKPHVQAMIDFSVFNKSVVSVKSPTKARARDLAMRAAMRTPVLGGWVERAGMKPRPRYRKRGAYVGLPRSLRGAEGTLAPQPVVRRYDGRPVRLDDALGLGWAVIGLGVDPRDLSGADLAVWQQVGATFATVFDTGTRPQGSVGDGRRRAGLVDLEDTTGELGRWLRRHGLRDGQVLVLRPDRFVFGASSRGLVADGRAGRAARARSSGRPTAASRRAGALTARSQRHLDAQSDSTLVSRAALRLARRRPDRPRPAIPCATSSATPTWRRRTPCSGRTSQRPGRLRCAHRGPQDRPDLAGGPAAARRGPARLRRPVRRHGSTRTPRRCRRRGCCSRRSRRRSPSCSAPTSTDEVSRRRAVRAAVDHAVLALEIVDSRIADWDISFADTVADNASSGLFVLGSRQLRAGRVRAA